MGRDSYNVGSTCDEVCREMAFELKIKNLSSASSRSFRERLRLSKVRRIVAGYKLTINKGVCDVDWIRHFTEALHRWPELRPLARATLTVAYNSPNISDTRFRAIEHLKQTMVDLSLIKEAN